MKKSLLLSLSNIKANKGQSISFLFMILISAMLLNLGLVTYTNASNNFDEQAKKANAEDCMIAIQNSGYDNSLYEEIMNNPEVTDCELRNAMLLEVIFDYNEGEQAIRSIILNKDNNEIYNKTKIVEESTKKYNKPIYLPLLLKTGGGYEIGDKFTFTSEGIDYSYTIAGFFENISLGSTSVPNIGFLLNDLDYNALSKELNGSADAKMFLIKLKNRDDASKYISSLYNKYSKKSQDSVCTRTYYSGLKTSRTFMSNIVAAIVVAFSIIIVAVSLVIVRFRIINSIEEDMQGIGALKACGYTSKNIIFSYSFQFLVITLVGSILGIGISYTLIPILSKALESQSGMLFESSFNVTLALISLFILIIVSSLTVYLSTIRIKKLPPIIALRNGIETHNFKRNLLPLHSTIANINFILGMKNFLNRLKQNISVTIIISLITFTSVVISILYYNVAIENKAFIDAIAGEVPSVSVSLRNDNYDETLKDELLNDDKVNKTLYYDTTSLETDDLNTYYYITEDYSKLETDICYEGRNPIHSNEIALNGCMADVLNKKIGDEVTVKCGDNSEKYIITGFISSGNSMGHDAEITTDGFKRINEKYRMHSIYIYLKDSSNAKDYAEYLKEKYEGKISNTFCVNDLVDTQLESYINISNIVIYAILFSSLLIISLMLYLIIKTIIIRNKTQYGIQKALGYTSKQLMLQLSYSFLPVTIIGSIIGGMLGYFLSNTLFSILFRNIGIMKIQLFTNITTIVLICILIIIFSFIFSLLISRKIKKISAISLMRE